jgi:hypothetical protein
VRDLDLFIPDPSKATLRDLARTIDAELVLEHTHEVRGWTHHTILVRDRWARYRFAIGKLCYPRDEPGPLAYVTTFGSLEQARLAFVERLRWYDEDSLRGYAKNGMLEVPRAVLEQIKAFLGI